MASAPNDWQDARDAARRGDHAGERAALHRILARDRRDLPALLAMGEAQAKAGDQRSAASWFRAALAQAAVSAPLPALHPMLARARAFCERAQADFAERFDAEIGNRNLADAASPALRHAIDLLYGRADIHLQQPTMFYYPGLPQRAFYERAEFAWVAGFEAGAAAMRDEFLALLAGGEPFTPYIRRSEDRPASSSALLESADWGAAYLWQSGEATPLAGRVPHTMAALAAAPMPQIAARSPMALYSRLRPGTHIAPHHGLLNTRLICHLPLVAPPGCGLRVGHETREWRAGELLIFDDSVEHEAWNRGNEDRTVLLFEIWRPEIGERDRAILAQLFEAIDRVDPARGSEDA